MTESFEYLGRPLSYWKELWKGNKPSPGFRRAWSEYQQNLNIQKFNRKNKYRETSSFKRNCSSCKNTDYRQFALANKGMFETHMVCTMTGLTISDDSICNLWKKK